MYLEEIPAAEEHIDVISLSLPARVVATGDDLLHGEIKLQQSDLLSQSFTFSD